jgi:DNA-binding CsgD family transcriptional regulator
MLLADDGRRFVNANAAACELLGMAATAVAWRTLDEFTARSGQARLEHQWTAFLRIGAAEGWYQLCLPDVGAVAVEFSALAHVLPGRHLLVFIASQESSGVHGGAASAAGAGWAPVPVAVSDRRSLTKREQEVMTLVAHGGQGDDMATRLCVSPETIKTHVQNAMTKLGAHTRAHAVGIALVTGQIIWSMYGSPGGPSPDEPGLH